MLKVSFPLRLQDAVATYDVAYGSIQRPCNGEEEPGQQWVDVTGKGQTVSGKTIPYGFSLLNDSKYGFDVLGSDVRMTLLRSPIYAYHDPYKPEPQRQYVYQDQGVQTATYRMVPHAGAWQDAALSRRAWELNVRPLWVNEYIHAGTLPEATAFLSAEPSNIVLAVCKKAEDSDEIIVRAYEAAGRATRAVLASTHLAKSFEVDFGAHEIKSLCVRLGAHASVTEIDMLERPY